MYHLLAAEEPLAAALRRLEPKTTYAEVLAQRTDGHSMRVDKSSVNAAPAAHLEGAVFRAWSGTAWVETATTGLRPTSIATVVDALLRRLPGTATPPPGDSATGSME